MIELTDILWNALDTGKVTVLLHYLLNPDQPYRLKVEDLHHWLFRMDPYEGEIFLGAMPDDPWGCEIDRRELVAALSEAGLGLGPAAGRQDRCREWLVSLMKNGSKGAETKSDYLKKARAKFSVSEKDFALAWKAALRQTGDPHGWARPGRPRQN